MKGVVFTELLEMVESRFGMDVVDAVLDDAELPSGGSYTAVGTYDHQEVFLIVETLSRRLGVPVPDLLQAYGEHLFGRFAVMYPHFFRGVVGTFDFLSTIECHIHVEVRKLYPDAELPHFQAERDGDRALVLVYSSARPLGDFARGLIYGCIAHYREPIEVSWEDLGPVPMTHVRFRLVRGGAAHD